MDMDAVAIRLKTDIMDGIETGTLTSEECYKKRKDLAIALSRGEPLQPQRPLRRSNRAHCHRGPGGSCVVEAW